MKESFDPSLCCLTVCVLEDDKSNGEPSDLSTARFLVLHGIHRVLALKELEAEMGLPVLLGQFTGQLSCYIVGTKSSSLGNWLNLKSNLFNSQFDTKPRPQDLLFIFNSMINNKVDKEKTLEAMERYMELLVTRSEDRLAMKRVFGWDIEYLRPTVQALDKFVHYETLDGGGPGLKGKQRRAEKLVLSNKHIKLLSLVDPH